MNRREKIEQMLEGQPNDPFLHYGLAMEHVKEGDIGAALERFDRTLSMDADCVAAYFHKANTLVGVGRIEEASAILRAGIEAARRKKDSNAEGEMQGLLDSLG
jgi:thioredoxin-like negative regulator of GroEL